MLDTTLFETLQSDELPVPYCSRCGEPVDECNGHQNGPESQEDVTDEELPW